MENFEVLDVVEYIGQSYLPSGIGIIEEIVFPIAGVRWENGRLSYHHLDLLIRSTGKRAGTPIEHRIRLMEDRFFKRKGIKGYGMTPTST